MLLMAIMLGTILAIANFVDGQTKMGANSRKRETAFNITEAALNGQLFALSQAWPGLGYKDTPYVTCTQASTGTKCPNAPALAKLIASPDTSVLSWQTEIHDNGGSSPNFYSDAVTRSQPGYDFNDDGMLWVRSTATTRGKTRTVVTLVKVETQQEDLPHAAVIANRLSDSNNGQKTLINMSHSTGANGFVGVRCTPTQNETSTCLGQPYTNKDTSFPTPLVQTQLAPYSGHVQWNYPQGNLVSPAARERLRQRAIEDGTFYAGCPTSLPVNADIIWIDSGDCQIRGNGSYQASMIILNTASIEFLGTSDFYGVIYAINSTNRTDNVVMLHGTGQVHGGILVEGDGGVDVGSSGNAGKGNGEEGNLIFDDNAFNAVKSYGNAGIVQNTWREIKN